MNSAVTGAVGALVTQALSLVGSLNPIAKAATAALVPWVGALVNMAFAGRFNVTSVVLAAVGVASGVLTYLKKNGPNPVKPKPAPTPAPAKAK